MADHTAPVEEVPEIYKNPKSLEFGFRVKRFAEIQPILQRILDEKGRAEILDLGGSEIYWNIGKEFVNANRERLHFTIVNLEPQESLDPALFSIAVGNACDPQLLAGRRFDFVHSNSVIEHVGDRTQMERFAQNTRRLADRYYMQTPNYWFPYEPHFRFPGFQWLPASGRALLMTKMKLGFFPRLPNYKAAKEIVESIRLLTVSDVAELFPDATIKRERVMGMSKSIMAIKG